jgi:hypothetical protein
MKTNTKKLLLETTCGMLPWCVEDPEKLGPCITEFMYTSETYVKRWSQKWFENYQFIYGNQQLRWSKRYDFAVDYDFLRKNNTPLNQKSQTNISRVIAEALTSAIYGTLPTWEVTAADESSQKGTRLGKLGEKILDYHVQALKAGNKFRSSAAAFVTFGQVAIKVEWDKNGGGLRWTPRYQRKQAPVMTTMMVPEPILGGLIEKSVPATDMNGQPIMDERWEPVKDQYGKQQLDPSPLGGIKLTIRTPFSLRRSPGAVGLDDAKWIEDIEVMDFDEFLSKYKDIKGKTRFFEEVSPGLDQSGAYSFALRHYMRMHYVVPSFHEDSVRGVEVTNNSYYFNTKVLVVEHYDRPDPERWPMGRLVIVANGQCVAVTEPQFHNNAVDGWHPYSEALWWCCPPSNYATGPMNDVIGKNRELNVTDSLISTSLLRNLGSQLLIKVGSGLDRNKISGTPGEIHEVNDPGNAALWLHDPTPISPAISQVRTQHKDDVYETSGAQDSLRGDRSKGVTAGYALRQLQEREERRLTPARDAFADMIANVGAKILACFQQNAVYLGDQMMGYLRRSAAGEFTPEEVVAFMSSSMDFGCDVKVREGSMALKSKGTQQATLMDLAKGPLGQRLANDDVVLDNFLKYFDAEQLRNRKSSHRDRASRENNVFADMLRLGSDKLGASYPIVLFEDDDAVHVDEHTDFFVRNAEDIMKDPDVLNQFIVHIERHRIQGNEKQATVPPGSSQQVPQMMAQGLQPQTQTIVQEQQMRKAQGADQPAQGPAPVPPPAPKGPGGQTPAQAPSGNTPQAKQSKMQVESKGGGPNG